MNAITTQHLTKVYKTEMTRRPVRSLDALTLEIEENELFGFLGRNGAGKTTTIKLLCHLLHPTAGEAFIFGKPARHPEARRHIGYLPETPYFYEYLTPHETILFYGKLNGLPAKACQYEWDRLSEQLDLRPIANQRIREFSKGMRQRLGFAVALVGNPSVLILDEPMSGLDPLGRRAARELILRLREEKKTVFFSSHVLSDVEQICDRVGIIVKGKLMVQGKLNELLREKVERVEVIASGLSPQSVAALVPRAVSTRASESGHHFEMTDLESANALVRLVHGHGGLVVEFTPIRQSLEDYFTATLSEQGQPATVA